MAVQTHPIGVLWFGVGSRSRMIESSWWDWWIQLMGLIHSFRKNWHVSYLASTGSYFCWVRFPWNEELLVEWMVMRKDVLEIKHFGRPVFFCGSFWGVVIPGSRNFHLSDHLQDLLFELWGLYLHSFATTPIGLWVYSPPHPTQSHLINCNVATVSSFPYPIPESLGLYGNGMGPADMVMAGQPTPL